MEADKNGLTENIANKSWEKIEIILAGSGLRDNKGRHKGAISSGQQTVGREYEEQNVPKTYLLFLPMRLKVGNFF